jgi:hypothetical protein
VIEKGKLDRRGTTKKETFTNPAGLVKVHVRVVRVDQWGLDKLKPRMEVNGLEPMTLCLQRQPDALENRRFLYKDFDRFGLKPHLQNLACNCENCKGFR